MLRAFYLSLVAAIFAFVLLPLVVIVWASFFSDKILAFPPHGYSLVWYARAWAFPDFFSGFIMSVQLGAGATICSLIHGEPAAYSHQRFRFRGQEAVRQTLLSPMYVPAIVAGAAIYIYFIQVEILTRMQFAATFFGLLIAHVLVTLPWTMWLVSASLAAANVASEEAARSLGANALQTFLLVTLPIIRPGIIAASLFSFIVSFSDLEISLFLVGPGKTTLPIAILNYLEWNLDSTVAAVAAVQIFIIGAALLVANRFVNLGKAF